jgi:hypothetical protein
MHIIFQLVMIKNNLFVPCTLVSFMRLHRLETHDYIGYLHDILGYFCILKGAYHSLQFSLPDTTVFQYLTRHTYVSRLLYYMISIIRRKLDNKIQQQILLELQTVQQESSHRR